MEKELKILLSLEKAKKWYNSEDNELKVLVLSVYTKEELEKITLNDIVYKMDSIKYDMILDKTNAYRNIFIIAEHFNNNWQKIDNVIGYFYSYNYNTKEWILREHNTVTYTGIIYYKNKKVAAEAFELSKQFYEMLI